MLARPPDDQQPSLLSVLLQRQVVTNKNNFFYFDLADQEEQYIYTKHKQFGMLFYVVDDILDVIDLGRSQVGSCFSAGRLLLL